MNEEPWYVGLFSRDYYRGYAPRIDPELTAQQVWGGFDGQGVRLGQPADDRAGGEGHLMSILAKRGTMS